MKLFKAIAATAVLTTSLIASNPVSASSKWTRVYTGQTQNHEGILSGYISNVRFSGNVATFDKLIVFSNGKRINSTMQMDCRNARYRGLYSNGWGSWDDLLPGTPGLDVFNALCR